MKKTESTQKRDKNIISLHKKGLTERAIAAEVGWSRSTVNAVLKKAAVKKNEKRVEKRKAVWNGEMKKQHAT